MTDFKILASDIDEITQGMMDKAFERIMKDLLKREGTGELVVDRKTGTIGSILKGAVNIPKVAGQEIEG